MEASRASDDRVTQTLVAGDSRATTPDATGLVFVPGEIVAERFSVVRLIGLGGMGQVFEAVDLELGQTVAIKTIRPDLARTAEMVRRFRSEVRLAREVTHPNVCRLHDLYRHRRRGRDGDRADREVLVLSMEYLEGRSLYQRLRDKNTPATEEVRSIAIEISRGIAAAHAASVIHRDLTPSNVILTSTLQGRGAVVTDFGIACLDRDTDSSLKGNPGTLGYAAPEVLQGSKTTPASDVYSIGVIILELLCGPEARSQIHLQDKLDVQSLLIKARGTGRTFRWSTILSSCLESRPDHRYANGTELKDALESLILQDSRTSYAWRSKALVACLLLVSVVQQGRNVEISSQSGHGRESGSSSSESAGSSSAADLHNLSFLRPHDAIVAMKAVSNLASATWTDRRTLIRAYLDLADYETAGAAVRILEQTATNEGSDRRLELKALAEEAAQHWFTAAQTWDSLAEVFPGRLDYSLPLAENLDLSGRCRDALKVIDRIRTDSQIAAADFPRVDLVEAQAAGHCGEFERQLAAAERTLTLARDSESPLLEAKTELALCQGYRRSRQPVDEWRKSAIRARQLFLLTDHRSGAEHALVELGWCAATEGKSDDAMALMDQALQKLRAADDRIGIAAALNGKAGIEWSNGSFSRARDLYLLAQETSKDTGRRNALASYSMNIGATYKMEGRFREAIENYQQALSALQDLGETSQRAILLSNIAATYQEIGELEAAFRYAQEALELSQSIGDQDALALALINHGESAFKLCRFDQAERDFLQALEISKRSGDSRKQGYALLGLVDVYQFKGPQQKSRENAELAVNLFDRTDLTAERVTAEIRLATIELASKHDSLAITLEGEDLLQRAIQTGDARIQFIGLELLVDAYLLSGDAASARAVLSRAQKTVGSAKAADLALEVPLLEAKVLISEGQPERGRLLILATAQKAEVDGYPLLGLEARGSLCLLGGDLPMIDRSGSCWSSAVETAADR